MRPLRILTALGLLGIAVVHLDIASSYAGIGSHPLSLSDQFYAQGAAAIALAVAVVAWPHRLVSMAIVGFAVASLAGLIYSRYRCLPLYGFHGCFQETWSVRGAKYALFFEVETLVCAGVLLLLPYRRVS